MPHVAPKLLDVGGEIAKFTFEELTNFGLFKNDFNKSYTSKAEEQQAQLNFLRNQKEIKSHNMRYLSGLESYLRAVWDFSDLTPSEIRKKINRFKRPVTQKSAHIKPAAFKPPKSLNWVTKGYVTPGKQKKAVNLVKENLIAVQNQKLCGSCWSFSSIGAIEGQIFKKTGKLLKLSEQSLIDCSSDDENGNFGCDGGDMITAFKDVIKQGGVVMSSNYPYIANDTASCQFKKSQAVATVTSYETIEPGDEKLLQSMLAQHGPIAIAVDASLASFQSYKTGVYYDPKCSTESDHAVLLVGYGRDEKTKKDYWLIKNSYGDRWGENG